MQLKRDLRQQFDIPDGKPEKDRVIEQG